MPKPKGAHLLVLAIHAGDFRAWAKDNRAYETNWIALTAKIAIVGISAGYNTAYGILNEKMLAAEVMLGREFDGVVLTEAFAGTHNDALLLAAEARCKPIEVIL